MPSDSRQTAFRLGADFDRMLDELAAALATQGLVPSRAQALRFAIREAHARLSGAEKKPEKART